ncbi:hypothetical protein FP74_gp002 [Bacillus phage CAM003]|uniref:Uncharacterized protein n=2 Tax=Bastillevirus TaxID=1918010 RepID=A0A024B110_9CAUD|nr:hypothetical protein FP73_gp002 [Bacillus phage Hoody T]YP_009036905.1 hypothetical protein FP74_gp002 [Bacillus phage CAM003]AHZ09439.1 hypothetical protein [Bacillus phage CAM003]AHZ10314.1 hypothetical protein [Bacillus phage Hoody T]
MLTTAMELAIIELKGIVSHATFLADQWEQGIAYTTCLVDDINDRLNAASRLIEGEFNDTRNGIIAIEMQFIESRIKQVYHGIYIGDRVTSTGLSHLAEAAYQTCNTITQYAMEVYAN